MNQNISVGYKQLSFVPIIGILLYTILFFVSKKSYGGGLEEFKWGQHLFCDLMEKVSHQGHSNNARTLAILGNTCLFIGMATFFYLIPLEFKDRNSSLNIVQVLGVACMLNFLFLFTQYHDLVVLASGSIGFVVVTLLIKEYILQGSFGKYWFEIICLILSIMVFISFQFKIGFSFLPAFQKSVFVLDSIWVVRTCSRILKMA